MSFLMGQSGKKAAPPKVGNIQPVRAPSNERGIAMRYLAGYRRLGITWLGPAYNQKSVAVTQQIGKRSETVGYNYYADVAGIFCYGPADTLYNVLIDGEVLWSGPVNRSGDSVNITIPARGVMTLYWGTSTQTINSILSPFGHPAYRNQVYAVFQQLLFGQDRTNAPTIEIDLFRKPVTSGLATVVDYDSSILATHAAVELLTDANIGLGWNASQTLDLTGIDATANILYATEQFAISPLLDTEDDASSVLAKLMQHIDGFIVPAKIAGSNKLTIKLARQFSGDPSFLPFIGEYDMVVPPIFTIHGWNEVANECFIKFTDRDAKWETDSEPYRSAPSGRISADGKPYSGDLSWITQRYQAAKAASRAGRVKCVPTIEGKIEVRWRAVPNVRAGDFIVVTYTHLNATIIFRVTRRTLKDWKSTTVELELLCDAWYSAVLPFRAEEAGPGTPPTLPAPGASLPGMPGFTPSAPVDPSAATATQMMEAVRGLCPPDVDLAKAQVFSLVARSTQYETRIVENVSEDNTTYRKVEQHRGFALKGVTVDTNLGSSPYWDESSTGFVIDLVGADNLAANVPSTNEQGRQTDRCLCFAKDTFGNWEIMSYRDTEVVSANRVRLRGIIRGRFLSRRETFANSTGFDVWIIRREDLAVFTEGALVNGATRYFKPQPSTEVQALTLASVTAQTVAIKNVTGRPPRPYNFCIDGYGGYNPHRKYITGADTIISWTARSWDRYSFPQSLGQAQRDVNLQHVVRINVGGPKREILLAAGVTQYRYVTADRIADGGGSEPTFFQVQVFTVQNQLESLDYAGAVVEKVGTIVTDSEDPDVSWFNPALSRVLGSVDPYPICERNFQILSLIQGVTYGGAGVSDYAKPTSLTTLQANFVKAASAFSVTLLDVSACTDPESASEENFRRINDSAAIAGTRTFYWQPAAPTGGTYGVNTYWIDTSKNPQEWHFFVAAVWQPTAGYVAIPMGRALAQTLTPSGAYDGNRDYQPGDLVGSGGNLYLANYNSHGSTPVSNPSQWTRVDP